MNTRLLSSAALLIPAAVLLMWSRVVLPESVGSVLFVFGLAVGALAACLLVWLALTQPPPDP